MKKTSIENCEIFFVVIAFAAACTAGILYPLDWIMGIRLAKEDELEGLDLTGIIDYFLYKIQLLFS
jgi:ammonia channel protein AmtB